MEELRIAAVCGRAAGDIRKAELIEALRANRWRIKATARQLVISRAALYRLMEQSSGVRKASDLGREEIELCRARCGDDIDAMVDELEVSKLALRRRMGQLGLGALGPH